MPTYEDSLSLFHTWTTGDSLRKHAYAVEAAMAFYANHFSQDSELWRMTGLLHDMDYEKHPTPDEHPFVGVEEMRKLGYPEEMLVAILGHATYSGTPRETLLAKTLFAVDELSGFITACAYVRPTRLEGMSVSSVKKKLKDKRFAAAVSREDIQLGASELEIPMEEHIANVIKALSASSERLGF